MWDSRIACLAIFIDICLAQKGAVKDLRARRASRSSSDPLLIAGAISSQDGLPLQSIIQPGNGMIPSARSSLPQTLSKVNKKLELRSPQEEVASNVYVTILFPSSATASQTSVAVPQIVTYTGTFNAAVDVPSGYQTPSNVLQTGTFTGLPHFPFTVTAQPDPSSSIVSPATTATTSLQSSLSSTSALSSSTSGSKSYTSRLTDSSSTSHRTSHTVLTSTKPTTSSTLSTSTSSTSTSTSSTSSNTSSSSSSTTTSSTASTANNLNGNGTTTPDQDPHLSSGAIAGIVIGVVGGIAALAAALLYLLRRRLRPKAPDSPGIYPQEAYLYDPPITPPDAGGAAAANVPRTGSPEMMSGANEHHGLLAGAGAGVAAGAMGAAAASRGRRGTLDEQQRRGNNGYSPVDTRDITEQGAYDPYHDPTHQYSAAEGSRWPLNPGATSGSGTPTRSSGGLIPYAASTGSGTPPHQQQQQYRDSPPQQYQFQGPSIAGVGSPRYDRRISNGNLSMNNRSTQNLQGTPSMTNRSSGNISGGSGTPPRQRGEYNPAMREARRAFGMDDQ